MNSKTALGVWHAPFLVTIQWSRVGPNWSRSLPISLLSWSQQHHLTGSMTRDRIFQTISRAPDLARRWHFPAWSSGDLSQKPLPAPGPGLPQGEP